MLQLASNTAALHVPMQQGLLQHLCTFWRVLLISSAALQLLLISDRETLPVDRATHQPDSRPSSLLRQGLRMFG